MAFHVPERSRVMSGEMASSPSDGNNGFFHVLGPCGRPLIICASDGLGWEHVSVSMPGRCPNWVEMCAAKALFWDPEDVVVQFHPRASEYVNCHPNCLHLWRQVGAEFATPPPLLVGPL